METILETEPAAPSLYVGLDVAKATLQIHLQGKQLTFPNTPAGHVRLCKALAAVPGAQVVCEATGGYETPVVRALHAAQIRVSVVNPARVLHATQAQGLRAKTDPCAAAALTDYGQRFQPPATPPRSRVQTQLEALVLWLTQTVQAQAVAKTQAEHQDNPFVAAQHALRLAHYEEQIEAVEAQIQVLLGQDEVLARRAECLDAIAGVGPRTAVLMLAHLPELGRLNRREVAALAGLAPFAVDSGEMKGARHIRGGRSEVRRALYMPALTAIRSNKVLKTIYEKLIAGNKPPKVALTAVMRRMLIHMNSELKKLAAAPAEEKTAE